MEIGKQREYEQLDIFSYLKPQGKYCFDDDINEIHDRLVGISDKYGIQITKDEFTIWPHVPQYGYRLGLDMEVTKDNLQDKDFMHDIEKLTCFAKQRNIELSCMGGACFFFEGEETARLPFNTTFIDKARRKIKAV